MGAAGTSTGGARGRAAHGVARVATAHTQSDLVEGVLFRLATQPGRRALLGMQERSRLEGGAAGGGAAAGDAGDGVELVRPMLGLTRRRCSPMPALAAWSGVRIRLMPIPALRGHGCAAP